MRQKKFLPLRSQKLAEAFNLQMRQRKQLIIFLLIIQKKFENEFKNGHNCIIGVSGGVDSSYLLHLAGREFGLKPLVYHVDAGWNTQIAVNNIEKIVDGLNLDLYTAVINWEEMKDLQKSFFKSGVSHIDTPQDHAFFATMYKCANEHNIKYILTGGNYSDIGNMKNDNSDNLYPKNRFPYIQKYIDENYKIFEKYKKWNILIRKG